MKQFNFTILPANKEFHVISFCWTVEAIIVCLLVQANKGPLDHVEYKQKNINKYVEKERIFLVR